MAGSGSNNNQFNSNMYLSPGQEDLLMAALNSNNTSQSFGAENDGQQAQQYVDDINASFFNTAQQPPVQDFGATGFDNLEESPFVDFLDGDTSFDFDNSNGDAMIGGLPSYEDGADIDKDSPDKRKSPEDDEEEPEGGGKRREGEDKTAKKPGRKPLTSEPTTKRKAQNRAAQRAFRERKEKHLKDLETKVAELEKASDASNHENGLLRAQVQRLQTELREYRKRLSLNSTGLSRSPQSSLSFMSGLNGGNNNFQFEFPKFGGLPGAHILSGGPLKPGSATNIPSTSRPSITTYNGLNGRQNSSSHGMSPKNSSNGAGSPDKVASPQQAAIGQQQPRSNAVSSSPSLFAGVNGLPFENGNSPNAGAARVRTDSSSGQSRVFQFNSGSNSSTTDSPSASSVSQYGGGPNSSCGTSPEPCHNSPTNGKLDSHLDSNKGYVCHGNSEGEVTFCEKLNMACGNPRNPVPRAMSKSNGTPANQADKSTTSDPNVLDPNALDLFANQNGNQFDPTLFGDYRDPQAAIVGDGEFTGGFFDDAFNFNTYNTPFSLISDGIGGSPAVQADKVNPIETMEKLQSGGDDEVVPGDDMSQMLNCHKIWDKLASRPDFKDGTIDIDNLCSELRAKARCSESGVVVDNKDVEAALKRLPDGHFV